MKKPKPKNIYEVVIMALIEDRNLTTELRGALIEAKESIEGKRKLNTLDNLIVELKKVLKL